MVVRDFSDGFSKQCWDRLLRRHDAKLSRVLANCRAHVVVREHVAGGLSGLVGHVLLVDHGHGDGRHFFLGGDSCFLGLAATLLGFCRLRFDRGVGRDARDGLFIVICRNNNVLRKERRDMIQQLVIHALVGV